MKLTLQMILYFIRNLNPILYQKKKREAIFAGVKQFFTEDEQIQEDFLYVGTLSEVWKYMQENVLVEKEVRTFLLVEDISLKKQDLSRFLDGVILVDTLYQIPYLMNRLIDIFNRMSTWDKDMHIAALEGKSVQELINISEPIMEHFMIIFDASFGVLAYTMQTPCNYPGFLKTIENGYTEARIMEKIREKKILDRLKHGETLIAPAAEDDLQNNIYLCFYSDQTLLGYACVFYDVTIPDTGYLDLFKMFAENLNFCLKRDYKNHRYGQMMYETFLINLINTTDVPEEQLTEQMKYIDGLTLKGRFVLGIISFEQSQHVALGFLTRMIARQFCQIRPFIYQNQICLLKILSAGYHRDDRFTKEEKEQLSKLLANYNWNIGMSNVFAHISGLRYAYQQSEMALRFGIADEKRQDAGCDYRDYYYDHLFYEMEAQMPIETLQCECYLELKQYDEEYQTSYLKTMMCYLENDCNATHAAEELFVHRNTVRNMLQFVQQRWQIDMSNTAIKKQLMLSALIDQYLARKEIIH